MRITIDEKVCEEKGCSLPELLVSLLVKAGADIPVIINDLVERECLVMDGMFKRLLITRHWDDVVSSILLDSEEERIPDDRIEKLAVALMQVFPSGKKAGTCHFFRGNKKDTMLRLKKFFKLYGDKYTDEQIISAAKRYVESFGGDYSYMRILKYFIWKDNRRTGEDGTGYVEATSDLASYIDNPDAGESGGDWTERLV